MFDKIKGKIAQKTEQVVEFVKVSEELREKRIEVCRSCKNFSPKFELCKICGCYMPLKTHLATASCPLKLWPGDTDKTLNTDNSGE